MSDDLGAVLSRLLDVVVERETPILRTHGITMWEYAVLRPLADEPGMSQKELARRCRRDPTRLGGHVDVLSERGLIARVVDGSDRRRRALHLTERGREVLDATRRDIRAMEGDLLDGLSADEQVVLRRTLATTLRRLRERGWERSGPPSDGHVPAADPACVGDRTPAPPLPQ